MRDYFTGYECCVKGPVSKIKKENMSVQSPESKKHLHYLRMSLSYLERVDPLPKSPPCFNSNLGWTNQTLARKGFLQVSQPP